MRYKPKTADCHLAHTTYQPKTADCQTRVKHVFLAT